MHNKDIRSFLNNNSIKCSKIEPLGLPDLRSTPDPESNQLTKMSSINNLCTTQYTSCSKYRSSLFAKLRPPAKAILAWADSVKDNASRSKERKEIRERVRAKLGTRVDREWDLYNKTIVDNIIKNRATHVTSNFKDYLVYDEPIEFLKRYYRIKDMSKRLSNLTKFHNVYFKVFPNYIVFPEKHYMYKNIERKQRVIDDKQYCKMLNSQNK